MHVQTKQIRIEFRAVGFSTLLAIASLLSAKAQTPASGPPVPIQPATAPSPQHPLPNMNDLLRQAKEQQIASWKTLQKYTYRSSNSEQDFDSHGTIRKTTTKELETICVDVGCYQKLLAVDGKPISDDLMKRQNDYFDSEIAWTRERNQKVAAGQAPPPRPKVKNADDFGDGNAIYANFVGNFLQRGPELGTFSNLRRVELQGRTCIAIDYTGNPNAKSPNLLFGVFRNLAGTVWVDEQDHALTRIEGHVFQDYKVGAGLLADVHKGATLQMEWTKVNDEVWLPAAFSGRGSARIVVFSYHSEQLDQHWSAYRKFRTTSTILPSDTQVTTPRIPENHAQP